LTRSRKDAALKAFRKVHDSGVKVMNAEHEVAVQEEFRLLAAQTAQEMKNHVPLKDFFLVPSLRKRCLVGFATMFAAQGTFTLVINSDEVVRKHKSEVFAVLDAANEFKFSFKHFFKDDSPVNITWRLWLGVLVQFFQQMDANNIVSYVCHGAVACSTFMILFTVGLAVNTTSSLRLSVVSIFLWEFFFGASWCGLPWVYVPEIAPLSVRHIGTSMAVFTQWFVTFIVVKFGPMGISSAGWEFYLLFCVFNVLAVVFVFFCVKETKGLSLGEIDVLFAKKEYKHMLEARITRNADSDAGEKGITTEQSELALPEKTSS
ncbi:hypothetical protein LTR06_011242, partial [Exophiala xenobiotica]